jgi:hypothetical protein
MIEDFEHNFLFRHFINNFCQYPVRHFNHIFVVVVITTGSYITAPIHSRCRRVSKRSTICFRILDHLRHLQLYPFKNIFVDLAVVEEYEIVELIGTHLRQVECLDFRDVIFFSRFGVEDKSDGLLNFFVALGNIGDGRVFHDLILIVVVKLLIRLLPIRNDPQFNQLFFFLKQKFLLKLSF